MSRSAFSRVLAVVLVLQAAVWLVAAQCQPGEDYWKNKVKIESVDPGFNVTYHNHYKIVTNVRLNAVYVLYCTETAPDVSIDGAKFMKVPVRTVSVADHKAIPFIKMLGQRESISSVVSPMTVTSQCMQDVTTGESVDAVFVSGISNETNSVSLSIDWDTSPLGRAEWIKFIAVFYDLEARATEIYDQISASYMCNTGNINTNALVRDDRKSIAWVAYEEQTSRWHILTGERLPADFDVYFSALVVDAGAIPLLGTAPITNVSELHLVLSNFDIVVDQTEMPPSNRSFSTWRTIFGYTGERGSPDKLPPFLRQKQLYRTDKLLNENGNEDWNERAPSRPDLVLRDLIAIQYPKYDTSYITTWLRNLAKSDEVIMMDSAKCPIDDPVSVCKPRSSDDDDVDHNHDNDKNDGSKAKKIRAIVLGVVGGVLAIAFVAGFILWRRRKQQANERFLELRDDDAQSTNVPDLTQVTEVPRQ